MDRRVDYLPLFAPLDPDEVRSYREAQLTTPQGSAEQLTRVLGWIVGGAMAVALTIVILLPLALTTVGLIIGTSSIVDVLVGLPGLVILTAGAIIALRTLAHNRAAWEQRLRMSQFAIANGFIYERRSSAPNYPGAIFGVGTSRAVTDHFRTPDGRFLDFGNYSYVTGSGKNRTTHRWGFLAMQLDRSLPHMLLDSTANNGMFGGTNLPTAFRREQVLSLEGDFNRYFTLYCPAEYERDALYVFTPDLMALLIDEAAPYDVEIMDRWLFVYAAQPFPLADAATYQRLLRIVSTVGAKALSRTDRYVDGRIGEFTANIVAPAGQRLRTTRSWLGLVVVAVIVVVWALSFLGMTLP